MRRMNIVSDFVLYVTCIYVDDKLRKYLKIFHQYLYFLIKWLNIGISWLNI